MAKRIASRRKPARTTPAGQRIIAALTGAAESLERGERPEERFVVRTYASPDEPAAYDAAAVRDVRRRVGVNQRVFARLVGVSTILIQSWEQGKRRPSPLARRLLDEIRADPARWTLRLKKSDQAKVATV